MRKRGYAFPESTANRMLINDIKEALSYIAPDYDQEKETARCSSALESNYELPDGQVITLGAGL